MEDNEPTPREKPRSYWMTGDAPPVSAPPRVALPDGMPWARDVVTVPPALSAALDRLLAGVVLVPDLAGWRRERLPHLDASVPYFDLAPDWVCEVLSPSTEALDRGEKRVAYAREGVRHLWLVTPPARLLEVLRLDGGRWLIAQTFAGDDKVRAEPFDAIELDLSILWADVVYPETSR